jgi:hypothetical protein
MAGEAAWPLTREQHELLVMLASLIHRFGSERFLEVDLVRADKRDFPDPWKGTLQSMHQLLYRLCWHAYIDPEIVVEDHRPIEDAVGLLRTSEIEIESCVAGVATFHLTAIGNDDIAGMLAHKVGEVFLDLAPGEPFRSTPRVPDEREASVAAMFLGLGVPAANASMYRRHATRIVGREEHSEQVIAHAGGLEIGEATLLLAIQDILRDDVQEALSTLHGPQREWVEQWKEVLDPREDELRELLGLDEAPAPVPLARAAQPRTAPPYDEDARKRFNRGFETARVRRRSTVGWILGAFVGAVGFVLGPVGIATTLGGAAIAWWKWCRAFYVCADVSCSQLVGANDTACPHCGGTITATITQKELEAQWGRLRAAEDELDQQIDPSEFAGDPDGGDERRESGKRVPR